MNDRSVILILTLVGVAILCATIVHVIAGQIKPHAKAQPLSVKIQWSTNTLRYVITLMPVSEDTRINVEAEDGEWFLLSKVSVPAFANEVVGSVSNITRKIRQIRLTDPNM